MHCQAREHCLISRTQALLGAARMLWATGLALIAVAARRMAYLLWAGPCCVSSLFLLDQKKGTCAAVAPCLATAAVTAARMRRRGVLGQMRVYDECG